MNSIQELLAARQSKKPAPIRLSYSSLELLHTCERKFELTKLLASEQEPEDSEHFSFGHAFGTGVATYLITQNQEEALYQSWLAYWPIVESDKKTQEISQAMLMAAFQHLDNLLMEYEVVSFQGKPAAELSFRLNIDERYYFVGYVDVILRHRFSNQYVVLEVKHSSSLLNDLSPAFGNSGQALGYSIVLDKIVGESLSDYGVIYFIGQLNAKSPFDFKFQTLHFNKTLVDRLKWFFTLGLDIKHIEEMQTLKIFPLRGSSCLSWNKPCRYFGTCNLHSFDRPKKEEPDENEYQFVYELNELITDHILRIHQ